ncbi:vanin-like protein 1 isoform X2 [Cloeon dipterum]
MIGAAVGAVLLCLIQVYQVHSYVAAVVEFSPTGVDGPVVPPLTVANNLYRYEEFVLEAKKSFADIIVFPEYGLTTTFPSNNRTMALEFGQVVPQKSDNGNPCADDNQSIEYETVRRLSCMARDNRIYLVANLIERDDKQGAGTMLYNTNVAFDSNGTVVSRYRKHNLFGEFALNTTTESDISIFEAFGARFGMVTCFDLMFQHPAVTLVRKYGITDLIFPTAWIHELPFLTGVQTQVMWAHAANVNFLAAGYNHLSAGSGGSGIYQGKLGRVKDATPWETSSFTLIGPLPANGPKRLNEKLIQRLQRREIRTSFQKNRPSAGFSERRAPFYYHEDLTNYSSIPIEMRREIMNYSLCNNNLCCDLEVSGTLTDQTVFRFFVYDGVREFGNGYYKGHKIQTCALVRCKSSDNPVQNCGLLLEDTALNVNLNHVRISGNFNVETLAGPNIVDGYFNILSGNQYIFKRELAVGNVSKVDFQLAEKIDRNILTFGVWGAVFPFIDDGTTDYLRPASWILPTAIAVSAVFIVGCLLLTVLCFTPNKYK